MNSILTGNNQTRPSMIILPLDIGGQPYGDVVLTQDYVLESEITYGKCKSRDLKEIGKVELKEDRIEVIPHSHCLPERKLFRGEKPQLKEVPFSFYLNYYYEHRHFSHGQRQPEPVYTLQPGLYLKGLFMTAYKDKERVRDYRFSYDFPEKDINFSAGFVFSKGFSTVNGYYRKGITLSRKPMSGEPLTGESHRIVLPTQSEVEVYRNGILVQKLTLPAGIYHFENLPVSGLTNELTIRIRDSFGRVREEKLFLLYSPDVLRKGKTDFSVGLYEHQQVGFVRYGYTDNITLNLAGNREKQGLGADFLTKYGMFSVFGSTRDYETKYFNTYKELFSFGIALRENFILKERDYRYSIGTNYRDISLNLYGYKNRQSYAGINMSYRPYRNTYLSLSYTKSSTSKETYTLTFTYLFGKGYHSFTSAYGDKDMAFTVQKSPLSHKVLDYGYRISYQHNHLTNQDYQNVSLMFKSLNIIEVRHSQSGDRSQQSVSLSGSIGCVYHDGLSCGMGLPVYDAFVVGRNLRSTYGNAFFLLPVPSYQNLKVSSEVDMKKVTFDGALRYGQGMAVKIGYDALVSIYYKGEPLRNQKVLINGEEYITTSEGKVFLENLRGEIEIEYMGIRKRLKVKDGDVIHMEDEK